MIDFGYDSMASHGNEPVYHRTSLAHRIRVARKNCWNFSPFVGVSFGSVWLQLARAVVVAVLNGQQNKTAQSDWNRSIFWLATISEGHCSAAVVVISIDSDSGQSACVNCAKNYALSQIYGFSHSDPHYDHHQRHHPQKLDPNEEDRVHQRNAASGRPL